MDQTVGASIWSHRLILAAFGAVGALSLLVGVLGIYSLMSIAVQRRSRDIGVRMALGADRWTVVRAVLKDSAVICILGGGLGLGAMPLVRLPSPAFWSAPVRRPASDRGRGGCPRIRGHARRVRAGSAGRIGRSGESHEN